jgi:hypothetical protein
LLADDVQQRHVILNALPGHHLKGGCLREGAVTADAAAELDSLEHSPPVPGSGEEVQVDDGRFAGLLTIQAKRPNGIGLDDGGREDDCTPSGNTPVLPR